MIKKLQTKRIFENTSENFTKLFSKHEKQKTAIEMKTFSVMLIFQNSNQNFMR